MDQEASRRDCPDPAEFRLSALKRQAALFRVFAYDASGACLGEADGAKIEWTVRLANRKASAPRLSSSEAGHRLRNKSVAERWKLEITPQPRTVAGAGQRAVFDDGAFMDRPVYLGEIRTDTQGRLLVLGGHGRAATCDANRRIRSHTDNDCWHDDVADGPVTARVGLADGRCVEASPSWVIVLPPDFAPGVRPAAALLDAMMHRAGSEPGSSHNSGPLSFQSDILPILERLAAGQWVSLEAYRVFGAGAAEPGIDLRANLAALSRPEEPGRPLRELVWSLAKRYSRRSPWLRLTRGQLDLLRRWAEGEFTSDCPAHVVISPEKCTASPDPVAIDRAALASCPAGTVPASILCNPALFVRDDPIRLDIGALEPGAVTREMPCPWQADLVAASVDHPAVLAPEHVITSRTYEQMLETASQLAELPRDGSEEEQAQVLQARLRAFPGRRVPWARDLPAGSPGREEALVKEWSHLGLVTDCAPNGSPFDCNGVSCCVETERSPYLGSMAEYFHRLVNIERNRDFAPKAMELALAMLEDAKFSADPRYALFRYTPEAFDERLERIYTDFVDNVMYKPVPWESGDITWDAEVDLDDDEEPVLGTRRFHVGRFSDRALAERFRQFAPLNLTDGAWLQNIIAAAPMDGVKSRLAAIWLDETGNGRPELNHSNVYETLLRTLNIFMPPVTSRDFIAQDFVPSAFESPVFQFCVGLFPNRFLPELLGMTLFVEWEATPTMHAIGRMMTARHIDPQYYRMHAAIDNIDVGHGAMAKEAIKLYLHAKQIEGGDAMVQEHWQRIWRGYVAWSTLGNCGDEIVGRMMLLDQKQLHLRSSLLRNSDILPPFVMALRLASDPVSAHLRHNLGPTTLLLLDGWVEGEQLPLSLLTHLRRDVNAMLRAGLYDRERFAEVELSAHTRRLLRLDPRGLDRIDLGRCLLEDAYPTGLARRPGFPDIKAFYAGRMANLIARKTPVALQSHRRQGWLLEAFQTSPEAVMQALVTRGLVDPHDPEHSRLFTYTDFSGPMYRVFSEEERAIIIDWVHSLRLDEATVNRPEPAVPSAADRTIAQLDRRASEAARHGEPELSDEAGSLSDRRWHLGMGAIH